MKTAPEIFAEEFKKGMDPKSGGFHKFRQTHPTLTNVILDSMARYAKEQTQLNVTIEQPVFSEEQVENFKKAINKYFNESNFPNGGVPYLKEHVRTVGFTEAEQMPPSQFRGLNRIARAYQQTEQDAQANIRAGATQQAVLDHLATAWNVFLKIPATEVHPSDQADFVHHLHALQNIMFAQLYLRRKGGADV